MNAVLTQTTATIIPHRAVTRLEVSDVSARQASVL